MKQLHRYSILVVLLLSFVNVTAQNNDEIFYASQEYLNFAIENNQEDFSKIMDEFEKITKSLGK